jgi:regulator of sirC expression with transglutaminase-like and TPR domain
VFLRPTFASANFHASPAQEIFYAASSVSLLRGGEKFFPLRHVEIDSLSTAQRDAFLGLLDDTSPAVRRALLARFNELGPAAGPFLQSVISGSNRVLARHATWFMDELKFADPVAEFRGFIRSLNYELETGALLLARTVSPRLEAGTCCTQLDAIANRCRELIVEPSSAREKCRILNRVLFHEWGFHGNVEHYTDPRNSFLDQVLERRTGIPLSLSIVYLLVAERLGIDLEPVGLPGHFIVGCFVDDLPFFIDPFDRGVFRDAEEIFDLLRANNIVPKASDLAPTPVREVLCRSCRNLVNHYTAAGEPERAKLFTRFVEEFEATYEKHASS